MLSTRWLEIRSCKIVRQKRKKKIKLIKNTYTSVSTVGSRNVCYIFCSLSTILLRMAVGALKKCCCHQTYVYALAASPTPPCLLAPTPTHTPAKHFATYILAACVISPLSKRSLLVGLIFLCINMYFLCIVVVV